MRTSDPRISIEARYPTHANYVEKVTAAAARLRAEGFLLPEDEAAYVARARALPWPPDVSSESTIDP